jgi:hypothetical protein
MLGRVELGMPLHRHHDVRRGFDRLDHAVGAPRHRAQAAAEPPHRLMVDRVDHDLRLAVHVAEQAPLLDRDRVLHRLHVRRAVGHAVAVLLRQMRDQIAAERDVQDLHAAADAENGEPVASERGAYQGQLEGVALAADVVVRGMRRAAVVVGRDVAAAGQQQTAEPFQHRGGARHGREQHRDAAGRHHRVDVGARDRKTRPLAGPCVRRDADQRPHGD